MKAGDKRAVLQALQERLARELEEASPREVAPLTGRLLEVMAQLEELSGDGPAKPVEPTTDEKLADEVARKRARRAADQARPAV